MKKAKSILTVVVIALAILSFGCSKKEAASSAGGASASSGPVTLKVANYAILEAGYEAFWTNVKTDFEAKNPGIVIEWITAPYGEIMNQVINMAGGGNKVDVIFGEIGWVPGLEDAGLAAPVNEILDKSFFDDFYPDVMNSFNINGKPYGLPLYISPYVLYYNKDLFTQAGLDPNNPPKTYDEMLICAEKLSTLKDANGNKVYAFGQTTASVPVSGSSINGMVFNFGGSVLDANGKLSVDNKGFHDAISMIKLLNEKGYNPQNAKLKDLRELFALGQLAMYYDQSWGFNGVSSINPDAKNFTASAVPLKGGNGEGKSILQAHCFILVDNGAARKAAVAKFCEYVISEAVLGDYMTTVTPAYPARKAMANMPALLSNKILSGASAGAANVQDQTFIAQLNDLNLELCTLAQAVTVGGENVDSAIENFKRSAKAKIE